MNVFIRCPFTCFSACLFWYLSVYDLHLSLSFILFLLSFFYLPCLLSSPFFPSPSLFFSYLFSFSLSFFLCCLFLCSLFLFSLFHFSLFISSCLKYLLVSMFLNGLLDYFPLFSVYIFLLEVFIRFLVPSWYLCFFFFVLFMVSLLLFLVHKAWLIVPFLSFHSNLGIKTFNKLKSATDNIFKALPKNLN